MRFMRMQFLPLESFRAENGYLQTFAWNVKVISNQKEYGAQTKRCLSNIVMEGKLFGDPTIKLRRYLVAVLGTKLVASLIR